MIRTILSVLLICLCVMIHSQSFKVHNSNLCGFSVQVPQDAAVYAETADYGIVFRSEYWQKMICFTPTTFANPVSLSDSELSNYLMSNNMSPVGSSEMVEGKYRVQKIKITNGQESFAGYCIFRAWNAIKGIAIIMMYADVNGFGDKLQTLALEYSKGFNNPTYSIQNPLLQSSTTDYTNSENSQTARPPEPINRSYVKLPRSGKTKPYSDKYFNFSFSVPEEFSLVPSHYDNKFVFSENNDYPKFSVYHNDFKSPDDIFASGYLKEDVLKQENGHFIFKSVDDKGVLYLPSVSYGPEGGTSIYFMDNKRSFEDVLAELKQVRKSLKQGKINQELNADKFKRLLSNKTLTFMYTASGYSEKKVFNLCGDGTFYRNSSLGGFSTTYNSESTDHFSVNSRSKGDGKWTVYSIGYLTYLRFNQNDNTYIEHDMYIKNDNLFLSGEIYFVTDLKCN